MRQTCLLLLSLGVFIGCASKPRFFQTDKERAQAERRSPEYQAKEAGRKVQWKAERKAAEQRAVTKREEYISQHPSLTPEIAKAIRGGGIVRGMNEDQVTLVMGRPGRINRSVGAYGEHQQWVYADGFYFLYFKNGILDSWESREP